MVTLLAVLGVLFVALLLDPVLARSAERFGPELTESAVKLDGVRTSLLGGRAEVDGFSVGNPVGYRSPEALRVGIAVFQVAPASLFRDVVIIERIQLTDTVISIETQGGRTNLQQLHANLKKATTPKDLPTIPAELPKATGFFAEKRYIIREFTLENGRIAGSIFGMPLNSPPFRINLREIGAAEGGFTPEEAGAAILRAIQDTIRPGAPPSAGPPSGPLGSP